MLRSRQPIQTRSGYFLFQRVDSFSFFCSLYVLMTETLGQAWSEGWRITARCAYGKREGMKSIRECVYRCDLDMETMVCTRGPDFPLAMLASRLMCPRCDRAGCLSYSTRL